MFENLMYQFLIESKKEYSFSEYFSVVSNQWGEFSFSEKIQKYVIYIFIGLAFLVLLKVAVKKILEAIEKRKVSDFPYLLRRLPTRITHMKNVTSAKASFTYRFINDEDNNWYEGGFETMDRKNNLVVALSSISGDPQDNINNVVEIKYSFENERVGLIKSAISKYLGSAKSKEGNPLSIYLIGLPKSIKLEQKRKDVRFNILPDYPIRVYLLPTKIEIPIACKCVDFSVSGTLVEFEKPEIGCLEYLFKKDTILCEHKLDELRANELTIDEILSQPQIDLSDEDKPEEFIEKKTGFLREWAEFIVRAKNFITSLIEGDIIEIFFILPDLPLPEERNKEFFTLEKRTIKCKAVITKIKKGDGPKAAQTAMHFVNINYLAQDVIYQYGLEMWRVTQKEEEEEEKKEGEKNEIQEE